jgi:DNA-binding PadR family transcriptional regulator
LVPKVEVVVLGLLAGEPMHGYDLLERFRERSMGFWVEVGRASVYQTLHRLEARGLIAGRTQGGREGPDRRVYRITRAGRSRLAEGLAERFGELAPYETEAGLALGFTDRLTVAEAKAAVAAREQAVRDLLDALADERARAGGLSAGPGRVLSDALLDRQRALAQAELAWLDGFRSSLGKIGR